MKGKVMDEAIHYSEQELDEEDEELISVEQLQSLVGFLNVHKAKYNDKMTGDCDMNTWIIDTVPTSRKDDLPNNWNFAEFVHDAIDYVDETDHTLRIQRSNDMGVENIRSELDVGIEACTSQYTNIDETMLSSTTSTMSTNEKVDDQDANPQNMDKEDTTDPSMSITEPMLDRGHKIKQPFTRL
ncbi:hypothetical protein KIW84_063422 [Lathyrus oleraceus]|uniref:Uncharacterized protein n=1 Tax=Pisum sativum TaxID=3888 RepID=A0A9D5A6S9_PEA|nr:hypothetical protein KIW84_063422 [Pisum sativum]